MTSLTLTLTSWLEKTLRPNNEAETWGIYFFKNTEDPHHKQRQIKAVGVLNNNLRRPGISIILEGRYEKDPFSRGNKEQFTFTNHVADRPAGEAGMKAFLMTAPNIGEVTAHKMWKLWGDKAAETVINNPALMESEGLLNNDQSVEAIEVLTCGVEEAKWYMPLQTLFSGVGFPKKLVKTVISQKWGDPVAALKRDPFLLLDLSGVGFSRCDALRRRVKMRDDDPIRLRAAVWHVLNNEDTQVWVPRNKVEQALREIITVTAARASEIIDNAVELKELIAQVKCDGKKLLAIRKNAEDEVEMVERLIKLTSTSVAWPDMSKCSSISGHQQDQLNHAFKNGGVAWLMGSAGSGKTYTAAHAIEELLAMGKTILVVAPTGKAALKVEQSLKDSGINLVHCITVHRALGAMMGKNGFTFRVDGHQESIQADVVVIDEASMMSNHLFNCLLRAIRMGTNVLCLGDPNQLSPVGRGTLLRDWPLWCEKNDQYTYGLLTEIIRNNGEIIKRARDICHGRIPKFQQYTQPGVKDMETCNYQMGPCDNDDDIQSSVIAFYNHVLDNKLGQLDPIRDIQVVVAVNDNSSASRADINKLLQIKLNPKRDGEHELYKLTDKVICTKNTFVNDPRSNGDLFIANGSLGYVTVSDTRKIRVIMDDHPGIELTIPVGKGKGDFDLAYAITCHKMQGSQASIVVTLLGGGNAKMVADRGWLYTAVTRAQRFGVIFANSTSVTQACRQNFMKDRNSMVLRWIKRFTK